MAWIEERLGHPEWAAFLAEGICVEDLPHVFQAEAHFTRASAAIACHRPEEARAHLDAAVKVLVRPSSVRNHAFLEARLSVLLGDEPAAERWCRAGAEHSFQGQGGDGLFLWGELHRRAGRFTEALAAWRLCEGRDPQSEWARRARASTAAALESRALSDGGLEAPPGVGRKCVV